MVPEKRLRLNEIADLIITSRSALTRSVEKLEKAGLIKKYKCKEDGRGLYATITTKGHRLLKEAWGLIAKAFIIISDSI